MTSTKSTERKKIHSSLVSRVGVHVCVCADACDAVSECSLGIISTNRLYGAALLQQLKTWNSQRRKNSFLLCLQTARFVSNYASERPLRSPEISFPNRIISAGDYKALNGWTRHFTYGNEASAIEAKTSRIIITKPNYSVSLDDNFMDGICNSFLFAAQPSIRCFFPCSSHVCVCVCELSLVKRYRTCHS